MARVIGPKKGKQYSEEFKATAVKQSYIGMKPIGSGDGR